MAKRPLPHEVICIDSSDDDDEDDEDDDVVVVQQKPPAVVNDSRKKIKSEPSPVRAVDNSNNNNNTDVEIVEPVAPVIVPASARKGASSADDDVVIVGATNVQRLPHMRHHCPDNTFDAKTPQWDDAFFYKRETITANVQCCDLCYCYCCDCPANECLKWTSASNDLDLNHCCASDYFRGWVQKRQMAVQNRQQHEARSRVPNPYYTRPVIRRPFPPIPVARATPPSYARDTKPAANNIPATPGVVNPLLASGDYHLREHCAKYKFKGGIPSVARKFIYNFVEIANNMECCGRCFCYVCDKPAAQCKVWRKHGRKEMANNHCCATQKLDFWRELRAKVSPGKPLTIDWTKPRENEGNGPFAPDYEGASSDTSLTKCRKCSWYSRLTKINEPGIPMSCLDWCHKCGRVASEQDFGKVQADAYIPSATDVFLGEKTIPFRLQARDPREIDAFKKSWQEAGDDEWIYDEAEMEEDMFRHRFGERPTLTMIMASIPILSKVPETSTCSRPTVYARNNNTALKSEAMILEQHNHKALLQVLQETGTFAQQGAHGEALFKGDLLAKFDRGTRSGSLTIRLFLPKSSFEKTICPTGEDFYSNVLGNWFGIYPFSLSALSGPCKTKHSREKNAIACQAIPCPPFKLPAADRRAKIWESRSSREEAMTNHNQATEAFRNSLSLISGSGSQIMGGISMNDNSLKGCLQRYCSDNLAQEVFPVIEALLAISGVYLSFDERNLAHYNSSICTDAFWVERQLGVVSHHRDMNNSHSTRDFECERPNQLRGSGLLKNLELFLTHEDAVLAASNLQKDLLEIVIKTASMKGMLEHLENLGHESVAYVEGLKIELLEFQRQALRWALDRELSPDGVQSYWWAKLPHTNGLHHDIYFNPILQRFRRGKPATVRGGFIASEMGLGKTILSLGLILSNPAPPTPPSGSNVKNLTSENGGAQSETDTIGWDKTLYAKTSDESPKRGSILSRATLVVCPVSLVGQWIEEAKSKLKDPGLVYPYHGQGRTRSPLVLAQNAIVVTTYAVIASDATYHAKKAKFEGYVPPLEQVRWWRIICDEGHSLKQGNTNRSNALMRIVADHKWLVSGTPVNTSFNDLSNQLKFLGVENAEDMMEKFRGSAFLHTENAAGSRYKKPKPLFGNFLFFLRSIMIRHTQKQKYRGTSTTLMSLPPKTERILEIDFSLDERQHYDTLEESARSYYLELKNVGQVSSNYLALTQKLNQTRIASAGGKYPLQSPKTENETDETTADDDFWEEDKKETKKSKVPIYSDFVFKSKLNTLIKELEHIRDQDPTAKSLVFSQYTSTLEWLQQELPKRGFQFRTLSGKMSMKQRAKALSDFQADPPTTIFLLSMRAGAVGINLTQANRIFLMEPSFNTALEAQAVGRVFRLGQKRSTQVTRLVMKDSVETRLLQVREKRSANGEQSTTQSEDKKTSKTPGAGAGALVGNVNSDRTAVMEQEFDLLFGAARKLSCSSNGKVGMI